MRKLVLAAVLFGGLQSHAAALEGNLYCKFPSGEFKGYFYMDKFKVVQILEMPGQSLNENPVPVVHTKNGSIELSMSNMSPEADAGKNLKVTLLFNGDMSQFVGDLSIIAADEAGPYPLPNEKGDCVAW